MDFSARLDGLQKQVEDARNSVRAASGESREQLRRRIDQAGVGGERVTSETRRSATASTSKWDQMRADAANKMNGIKARIDKRNQQMDAEMAAADADFAEAAADDAIDQAIWAVDNARLTVLDAIDARTNANVETGKTAS
jgi:hypothetical protein